MDEWRGRVIGCLLAVLTEELGIVIGCLLAVLTYGTTTSNDYFTLQKPSNDVLLLALLDCIISDIKFQSK